MMDNYIYKQFENIYENVMKKGITFSEDMRLEIQKEQQKMVEQRNKWMNQNDKKQVNKKKIDEII